MILTLAACNKKQQLGTSLPKASPDAHAVSDKLQETKTESPTAQTEEEFHWERVQRPLPDGESTIWAQAEAHGTVIAGTHKQLFALENGSWNELPVPDDFLYGNALCEDADGGFWFLYTTMNNSLAIARYGTDFAVQETFLTSCENEDQLYFQLLKTDGEFYLLSRERLVRLDENGALTVQDVDDTRDGRYFDSMADVNGTLYVLAPTAFDNVEHSYDELRQLDPATLEETAVLLEKQGLCGMGADAEGRLVLSRAAGLFAFDPETGSETEILRWNALDTAAITGIFLQSADGWLCEDGSGAITKLCHVPGPAPERKVLTLAILAGTGMETQAMQMVQDFNQSGTELRIEATIYSEEQAENTLDFLLTQIMAGDAPDLCLAVLDVDVARSIAQIDLHIKFCGDIIHRAGLRCRRRCRQHGQHHAA